MPTGKFIVRFYDNFRFEIVNQAHIEKFTAPGEGGIFPNTWSAPFTRVGGPEPGSHFLNNQHFENFGIKVIASGGNWGIQVFDGSISGIGPFRFEVPSVGYSASAAEVLAAISPEARQWGGSFAANPTEHTFLDIYGRPFNAACYDAVPGTWVGVVELAPHEWEFRMYEVPAGKTVWICEHEEEEPPGTIEPTGPVIVPGAPFNPSGGAVQAWDGYAILFLEEELGAILEEVAKYDEHVHAELDLEDGNCGGGAPLPPPAEVRASGARAGRRTLRQPVHGTRA